MCDIKHLSFTPKICVWFGKIDDVYYYFLSSQLRRKVKSERHRLALFKSWIYLFGIVGVVVVGVAVVAIAVVGVILAYMHFLMLTTLAPARFISLSSYR